MYKLKYNGDNALPCGSPFVAFISQSIIIIVSCSYNSINDIRSNVPNAEFSSDFIVGFAGETDENGKLLPDTQRLTKFGRILRANSLDELPELVNILKGEMSIVGPRPLGLKYIPYYTDEERHRHDIRPGLTGLAQVRGRNNLSWEEKFAYDIEYVNNISLPLDIKILFETVIKVFKHEGIGQGEQRPVSLHIERKGKELR